MRKILDIVLILGFLIVDFFFFHDFFKAGEVITPPQYMVGLLSVIVIVMSVWSLFKSDSSVTA